MSMYNPPHPGEILREDVLPGLGITITQAAQQVRGHSCRLVKRA